MAKAVSVPIKPVVKELTVRVRLSGAREFAVRCWIAARLAAVMAWVVGTKLDLTIELTGAE